MKKRVSILSFFCPLSRENILFDSIVFECEEECPIHMEFLRYACIGVCAYVYIYMSMYMCIYIYMYTCMCTCVHVHVCVHVYTYIYMCVCSTRI